MLMVEGIDKSFEKVLVLDGVDLTVRKGELVAVIGPNGAGKTTLFDTITGQVKPDRGRVVFLDEEITGLSPDQICQKGIARSFQAGNIFSRLSVFENVQVAVFAHIHMGRKLMSPAENIAVEKTSEILAKTGLSEKASKIAGTLSHGDQRLLEIAIALGSDPRLLILDEPTGGLSPGELTAIIHLLNQLRASGGITVLLSEHHMNIVAGVADSIMIMDQGRRIMQGTPEQVKRNEEVLMAYTRGS